jgi:hypothetical protein
MTLFARLAKWLILPPITGKRAIGWSIAAVAVPTLGRALVEGSVTGIAFIPYIPFVLLSAVFLSWKYAAVTAIASAAIADALFVGVPYALVEGPADVFGVVVFLGASLLIIALVQTMRTVVKHHGRPAGATDGIIFSEERGQAWASWPGASYYVRLGPQDEVAKMMEDYLAQLELAKRLNGAVHDKGRPSEASVQLPSVECDFLNR